MHQAAQYHIQPHLKYLQGYHEIILLKAQLLLFLEESGVENPMQTSRVKTSTKLQWEWMLGQYYF